MISFEHIIISIFNQNKDGATICIICMRMCITKYIVDVMFSIFYTTV